MSKIFAGARVILGILLPLALTLILVMSTSEEIRASSSSGPNYCAPYGPGCDNGDVLCGIVIVYGIGIIECKEVIE